MVSNILYTFLRCHQHLLHFSFWWNRSVQQEMSIWCTWRLRYIFILQETILCDFLNSYLPLSNDVMITSFEDGVGKKLNKGWILLRLKLWMRIDDFLQYSIPFLLTGLLSCRCYNTLPAYNTDTKRIKLTDWVGSWEKVSPYDIQHHRYIKIHFFFFSFLLESTNVIFYSLKSNGSYLKAKEKKMILVFYRATNKTFLKALTDNWWIVWWRW